MLKKISDCVYNYEEGEIKKLVRAALAEGILPGDILRSGLMKGMEYVGESFKDGDYFVPEVLLAAQTMTDGLEIIKPLLQDETGAGINRGKVVIGTVSGDLHDIGKKLVAMFMEGAGYEVTDLGIDVSAETFVEKAKETGADYLCMSAMLTTTMKQMRTVVDKLKEAGLYNKIIPVIGGAPVTQKYADEIGAYFAFDAVSAVELLNKF